QNTPGYPAPVSSARHPCRSCRAMWPLLLPETLDGLQAQEASALRAAARGASGWVWRNVTLRAAAAPPERLGGSQLRRLALPAEALSAAAGLLVNLQELRVQHLVVPSQAGRLKLAQLRSLRVLELPDLICTGPAASFADSLAGSRLERLLLPRAMLLECCARELVAQAVSAQCDAWQAIAGRIAAMASLREVDITSAWRPIAPERLRPFRSPGSAAPTGSGEGAESGSAQDLVPCEEDLLQLFESWCAQMRRINASFGKSVRVIHEDWDEERRPNIRR
ncbi:unnamed protein product, partial [Effrenium voratum]